MRWFLQLHGTAVVVHSPLLLPLLLPVGHPVLLTLQELLRHSPGAGATVVVNLNAHKLHYHVGDCG